MLKNFLKIIFSVGLFSYLVYQGKIDTKLLSRLLLTPGAMAVTLILIVSQNLSNSFRWLLILATQTKKKINFLFLAGINWIGLFFNTVLPGAVTGDLIKMLYVKQIDSKISKTSMVLTVLMDRIYGLLGLIILMGAISILRYERLTSIGPGLETIVHFNLLLLVGALSFFSLMFLPENYQKKFSYFCSKLPLIGKKTIHLNECFWMMAQKKKTLFTCVGISIISHNLGIMAFYHITSPFYEVPVEFLDIYSVIPVGMIITAIPISPGGMGVGHAAFEKILGYFQLNNGANLFNTFWIMILLNNILGLIPYLLFSKKKDKIAKTIQLESN
tara:strand:+ start:6887 stop:7873 length:987 start_codon:yes stop_codon:yes gene_type:complete